jgi:hypothetical protein
MYIVYIDCSGVSNIYIGVSSRVNQVYDFLGRYISVQADR